MGCFWMFNVNLWGFPIQLWRIFIYWGSRVWSQEWWNKKSNFQWNMRNCLEYCIFLLNFPIPHQKRFPTKMTPTTHQINFWPPPKKWGVNFFLPTLKLRNRSFYAQQNLVQPKQQSSPIEVCQLGSSPCSRDSEDVSRGGDFWDQGMCVFYLIFLRWFV